MRTTIININNILLLTVYYILILKQEDARMAVVNEVHKQVRIQFHYMQNPTLIAPRPYISSITLEFKIRSTRHLDGHHYVRATCVTYLVDSTSANLVHPQATSPHNLRCRSSLFPPRLPRDPEICACGWHERCPMALPTLWPIVTGQGIPLAPPLCVHTHKMTTLAVLVLHEIDACVETSSHTPDLAASSKSCWSL